MLPVDHPLALQFQRAVESLTAAQVWDSARQYRGTARNFLIYLGDNHPAVRSLDQLRRDPHILGWFTHLRSPWRRPSTSLASCVCGASWRNLPGPRNFPSLAHLIRREDFPRPPQRLAARLDGAAGSSQSNRNCSAATIWPPISSCCCAIPACASVNVSIFPGIASATSLRIVGPFTFPSAS